MEIIDYIDFAGSPAELKKLPIEALDGQAEKYVVF